MPPGSRSTCSTRREVIVGALQQAFLSAFVLIAALVWLIWRNLRDLVLVMTPLTLAGLLTGAVSVLAGLPINFADVIVLPLLLGIGVDSGIHLVHRHRSAIDPQGELLATSTSRAVLWSALTTIASFGSLGFASHRGMASLGQLLTLGIALMLVANLMVLPALIALVVAGPGNLAPTQPGLEKLVVTQGERRDGFGEALRVVGHDRVAGAGDHGESRVGQHLFGHSLGGVGVEHIGGSAADDQGRAGDPARGRPTAPWWSSSPALRLPQP